MKEITNVEAYKQPIMVVNPELNKYEGIVMFPEKLKEANDILTKYGVPKAFEKKNMDIELEKAFWISGTLKRADAEKNSFSLVVMDNSDKTFTINTVSETLNNLVKTHWDKIVKVNIQPKINNAEEIEYELIKIN